MFRTLFFIFGIYFLYRFIFGFIIPLFRTTNRVQQQFRTMQQKMEEQMNAGKSHNNQQAYSNTQKDPGKTQESRPARHEYIDFEEIK